MGPKPVDERCDHDLFRTELANLIGHGHDLVELGELIDWQAFADGWSPQFVSSTGRSPHCPPSSTPARLSSADWMRPGRFKSSTCIGS